MIKLNTERLIIYTASRDEMQEIIDDQTDDILKMAYREMLQGSLDHPDQWEWYTIWIIERKDGSKVGDLCFKLMQSNRVSTYFIIPPRRRNQINGSGEKDQEELRKIRGAGLVFSLRHG